MPLLDHFHAPLAPQRHWESFHSAWAGSITDDLNNDLLPANYFAEETTHVGARVEIDVATFKETENEPLPTTNGPTPITATKVWKPPRPTATSPIAFPDTFQVQVFSTEGGSRLVAAVELVSPGNKDRSQTRRAFAVKCANYLYHGISVIIVDIVTSRFANLHNELVDLVSFDSASRIPNNQQLYAVAYHPIVRNDDHENVDIWTEAIAVGGTLPKLPLFLNAVESLPIDLESTYQSACQRRRIGVT